MNLVQEEQMKTIELWLGKWDSPSILFNILSIEFAIVPQITSLSELEYLIHCNGDHNVRIRYADEPFGAAGELVQKMLQLFDQLRFKLGDRRFNYTLLDREQVTIDFSGCKYMSELFAEMQAKMEWDSWYGKNLDALWDILRGMPYKGDDFVIIRPRCFTGIPQGENTAFTDYVDKICSIFQRAQDQNLLTVQIEYTDDKAKDISVYMA